jgi:cobalt-zinc-cadmium resistance protein CzcA
MQYQVLIDPAKLAGAGLSVPDVATALGANNGNAGAASTPRAASSTTSADWGRVATTEDIGNVVLAVHDGTPVLGQGHRRGGDRRGAASRSVRIPEPERCRRGVVTLRTGEQAQTVLKGIQKRRMS